MDVSKGETVWSGGVKRILKDDGRLSKDFSSIRQFVHPDDLDVYEEANRATFVQGWPLDFEYRVKMDDNETRYLHVHRRVEHSPDGGVTRAFGMIRDVTAEREFENFLFRRDAILQVVGAFAERFLRESDWQTGMGSALQRLGKAAEVSRAFILRKGAGQDDTATLSMAYEWAAPSVEPFINRPEVQEQSFSPNYDRWRAALLRRKIVAGHISNFQAGERQFFELNKSKSIMLVPIFVGNEWWGVIGFSEQEERDWLPVEIESLTMVADIIGSAILRHRMEFQLVKANLSAEDAKTIALEASKTKSRFLANMSHEIRTPISGILGIAEMNITTGLTTEQREHMDMIRDAARALLTIVNDVLDISKIEADKMELKLADFELRPVLETMVRPFGAEAASKGLVFQYLVAEDVPVHVLGDPDKLSQILRNLIGNSMKFTDLGFVKLNVEVAEREDARTCLLFTLRDSGEGIAKEKLGTIFDSFTQADNSVGKKHQGTGLGLTISKELVEMMGGTIGVDSELGKGSAFSFTAWFDVSEKAEFVDEAVPLAVPQALHLNLLLAEDNPLNQKFLTHFLTMFGHTVTVAENGIEALAELERNGSKIDLVLMDIQMPKMGGIETTMAIRSSDGKNYDSDIPVIALTAYAMKGDKDRMIQAGMNEYVSKPVDMKELSSVIARSMIGRESAAGVPDLPMGLQTVRDRVEADGVVVDLDMDSLIKRFDGNMELLKDILDLFLIEAEDKLGKLDACLKDGSLDSLGMALHSITNIASHVLAMEVVNQSKGLERLCYKGTLDQVAEGVQKLRPKFVALVRAVRERAKTL